MRPKISVLTAVFNGERYLCQAIDSILNQSFEDFELILIDDASNDDTPSIISSYQDPRIISIRNDSNIGLTRSLNKALEHAKGEFIARQDADDISMNTRLARQFDFMINHSQVGLLGTACRIIDSKGMLRGYIDQPIDDIEIRWFSLLENSFFHSSVMIRSEVLRNNSIMYDERFRVTQDYDLWIRLLDYTQGANLQQRLVCIREGGEISTQNQREQMDNHDRIALGAIKNQISNADLDLNDLSCLRNFFVGGPAPESGCSFSGEALLSIYYELYQQFRSRYENHSASINKLDKEVSIQILKTFSHPKNWGEWFVAYPFAHKLNSFAIPEFFFEVVRYLYLHFEIHCKRLTSIGKVVFRNIFIETQ